jgi:hypothetical protein
LDKFVKPINRLGRGIFLLTQSKQECMSDLSTDGICQEYKIKCIILYVTKKNMTYLQQKHRSNTFYELKWAFNNQQELLYSTNKPRESAAEAYFILADLTAASSGFFKQKDNIFNNISVKQLKSFVQENCRNKKI